MAYRSVLQCEHTSHHNEGEEAEDDEEEESRLRQGENKGRR
jgi:hypothetical protein